MKSGQYDKAEPLSLEATEIDRTMVGENHVDYATAINNLAYLYNCLGQYEKSELFYLTAAGIFKSVKGDSHPDYATCLNNLGAVYRMVGKLDLSEQYYLEAIKISARTEGTNSESYATNLNNLAYLYHEIGQYSKSASLLTEAMNIRKNIVGVTHPDYADALNNLALLYIDLYQYEKAELLYLEAIAILKKSSKTNSISYATKLNNLATLYYDLDRFDKAEPLYLESIALTKNLLGDQHPDYSLKLNNLAYVYRNTGKYKEAEGLLKEAGTISKQMFGPDHMDYASNLAALATVYEITGDYEKALDLYEESRQIMLENTEKNFQFLSESEKEKYVSLISNNFQTFHNFYYKANRDYKKLGGSAFEVQLATRGMILNSGIELKNLVMNSGNDSLIRLYDQWKQYNILVAGELSKPADSRSAYLERWKQDANTIEKQLNRSLKDFRNVQQNYSWQDLRKHLNSQEAMVEFVSFNYHNKKSFTDTVLYSALVLTNKDSIPHYIPLFEEKQLQGLFQGDSLRTFANLLYTDAQVRTVNNEISYGDSLYQLIWLPLEPYLKNINRVYYSPSGFLHKITFDAIPCNDDQLLSDRYILHRVSDFKVIMEQNKSQIDISSISLFGGIRYDADTSFVKSLRKNNSGKKKENYSFGTRSLIDSLSRGGSWNFLPGAKKEVEDIANLIKKTGVEYSLYLDENGTEEKVKTLDGQKSPTVIHFSTHGYFFPDPTSKNSNRNLSSESVFQYSDNPLFRSGLIMAGANYVWKGNEPVEGADDGILTAYEVSNLYLPNTKLVVMSACETGLGEVKGSEGVYGLQRSFKMAGVDYIIMTLWQVLDKETSEFMVLFYQNLFAKKSVSEAFKLTQDTMKNKYRDEPYKWAGFVLVN